jgi:hypothetical protein
MALLRETLAELRRCGAGKRECQILWIGPWAEPVVVTELTHPTHRARGDGFELDTNWLGAFWRYLRDKNMGIRAQIHTHPNNAFHSATDDAYPIIHTAGFLSLVFPNFAVGQIGLRDAFLTELDDRGRWCQKVVEERLEIV